MADTQGPSPYRPCSTNWRASIRRSGGKWPPSFAVCPRPWPRCLTARRPHTCSASWLTCSIRPDQLVDLYRIRWVIENATRWLPLADATRREADRRLSRKPVSKLIFSKPDQSTEL